MKTKKRLISAVALLAAFAAGIIVAVLFINARTPDVPQPDTTPDTTSSVEETEPPEKLTDSIHLPGYSDIQLAADTCKQTVVSRILRRISASSACALSSRTALCFGEAA